MGASTSISHRHHMQGCGSKSGPGGGETGRDEGPNAQNRGKKTLKNKFKRRTFKRNVLDHVFVPVLGWGWGVVVVVV